MDDYVKFLDGPKDGEVVEYESADYPMPLEGGEYRLEPDLFAPHTPEGEPLGGSGATHSAEWHAMPFETPETVEGG